MSNIFSIINNTVFSKKTVSSKLHEEEIELAPYMLQRWCSMASETYIPIINLTTNRWVFNLSKKDTYRILIECLPQIKRKKINYIKKVSEKDKEVKDSTYINLEISEREYNLYKDTLNFLNTYD